MLSNKQRWIPALILGLATIGLAIHALFYYFISDDAYISFRYSWNLAHHGELNFNLGERVEGYTNFLWTVLLAGFLRLNLRPEVMSHLLGTIFGATSLFLVYKLSRIYRRGPLTGWDFLGALLLPAMSYFAVWCSSGLETQMFTALFMGGVTLYVAEEAYPERRKLSGLLFALATMTRPEGMLVFGLTVVHRWLTNLISKRRFWPTGSELLWVMGFVVPFGLFFTWRYWYYGYPLPNTFYIKASDGSNWHQIQKWGVPYLWDFVRENKFYVLAPLLFTFWPRRRAAAESLTGDQAPLTAIRPGFLWSYIALMVLPYAAYITYVGGDFMTLGRFFAPILPLIAFFTQEGLRGLLECFGKRRPDIHWRPWRMVPITALLLIGLTINSIGLYRDNQKLSYYRWGLDTVAYLKKFADDRVSIGKWMRKHLPPDTYVAVGGAGAIVYASRLKALDSFGLNDVYIAHQTPMVGDRPGHGKSAPDAYVFRKQPDLLCYIAKHQGVPYQPSPDEEQYWRSRGYHWVCLNPPGLTPPYYCCLKRLTRELGPFHAQVGG